MKTVLITGSSSGIGKSCLVAHEAITGRRLFFSMVRGVVQDLKINVIK